jgi:hypothetical protein
VIFAQGVATDPLKITTIQQCPSLDNAKMLRSFLDFVGYYRKFIRHFEILCKPLTELLKKYALFQWTTIHEQAFSALKQPLVEAPVLASPDFSKQFQLETNAGEFGVGEVLM